jgi:alpha-1,2-mannosyltransferase
VAHLVIDRGVTAALGLLLLGPPLTVGALGLGLPLPFAILAVIGLGLIACFSRAPAISLADARRHPVAAAVLAVAFAIAVTFSIRTSLYEYDPDAVRFSVAPGDKFREEHLCMTAYAEAARFAAVPETNVYARELYRPAEVPRRIGRFTVDYYHYPPPFLLLPTAVRLVAPDFYDFRRVWFAMQVTAVVGLWLTLAWWIGGPTGRRFGYGGIVLMAMPVTWASLQVGNIQTTVAAAALVGAMAVASGRVPFGTALLAAAALGKIFPGVLLAHVLAWWRPKVAAWALAWGIGITLLTAATFGTGIFGEFAFGELPRMLSGESFSQTEFPWSAPVNQSIYGFTVKLRWLGLTFLDREAGKAITRVLVILLGVAVLVVGWRVARTADISSNDHRLGLALICFGFLNLASLISPFVGGAYGAVFTIWLALLVGISTVPPGARRAVLGAAALLFIANGLTASPRQGVVPSTAMIAAATLGSVALFGINIAAVWIGTQLIRGRLPAMTRTTT